MRRIWSLMVIVLFITTGCAVLTPSQVVEVEKFAKATAAYSAMPHEVMKTHAELRSNVKIANASASLKGESAWKQLEDAKKFPEAVELKAIRAERACNVLKNYGNLLSVLAGDEYTAKLLSCQEVFFREKATTFPRSAHFRGRYDFAKGKVTDSIIPGHSSAQCS